MNGDISKLVYNGHNDFTFDSRFEIERGKEEEEQEREKETRNKNKKIVKQT